MAGEFASGPQELTEKQRKIYALAVHYYAAVNEPCSLAYLSRRLKKNPSTIRAHVWALVKKGWATRSTPAFRRLLG